MDLRCGRSERTSARVSKPTKDLAVHRNGHAFRKTARENVQCDMTIHAGTIAPLSSATVQCYWLSTWKVGGAADGNGATVGEVDAGATGFDADVDAAAQQSFYFVANDLNAHRAFYGDGRAFDGADDFAFLLLWKRSSEGTGRKKQLNTHGYANRQDGSPGNPRCGVGKFFALAVP